jgi:hypothetical protein
MAVASNFPVQIQNQGIVNVRNSERTLRSVLTFQTPYLYFSTTGYSLMTLTINPPVSFYPTVLIEASNDGINYGLIQPISLSSVPSNINAFSPSAGTNYGLLNYGCSSYQIPFPGKFIRISLTTTGANGGTIVNVLLNNGSGISKQSDLQIPNISSWSYVAASGGITNTTAVGLSAAATNVSFANILLSLDLVNAGLTDTEVIIRSNATVGGGSPTIIWRTFLKAGTNASYRFTPGIKAVAGRLIEVILSATATVYVNAQGTQIMSQS